MFTLWSQNGLKGAGCVADTGDMEDQRTPRSTTNTCNEVRSTRLHYRLRCLLHPGHDGEHRWTPELVPVGTDSDEAATG